MTEQPRPRPGDAAPGDPPAPDREPAPPSAPDAGRDDAAPASAPAPWDAADTAPWDAADTPPWDAADTPPRDAADTPPRDAADPVSPEPDDTPPPVADRPAARGSAPAGGPSPGDAAPLPARATAAGGDGAAADATAPADTAPVDTAAVGTPPVDTAAVGTAAVGTAAVAPSGADAGAAPGSAPEEEGPRPARRRRDPLAAALIGVLTLLLGFAIAVQVRTIGSAEELQVAREEDLVRILDELEAREDRLREQLAEQRGALRDLSNTDSRSAAALQEARDRAEALGILNGTVAAEGPGLVMGIRDPRGQVRVADLLDAIQELRGAGAETMQIDGVRIGVSSAVTGEPGELRIDGEELDAPYEVLVIGSPQDLETAMNIPGGVVDRVGRQGGSVEIVQSDRVLVDALRPLDTPQYAQPQTDDGD